MQVLSSVNIDMQQPGSPAIIHAMQGDILTRGLVIRLYCNGTAWPIPDDVTDFFVVFCKPDGKGGKYNRLPDGTTPACTRNGNEITVIWAPQVLTCAGHVLANIIMTNSNGDTLATFPLIIIVEQSAESGIKSQDYWKNPTLSSLSEKIGNLENLSTSEKKSLVLSINELFSDIQNLGVEVDLLNGNTVQKPEFERVASDVDLLNTIVIDDLNENAVRGVNGKRGDELGVVSINSSDIMTPSDKGLPILGTVTDLLNYGFEQIQKVDSKADKASSKVNESLTQLNTDLNDLASRTIRSINGIAPAPGNGTVEITSSDITMEEEGYEWNGNVTDALDKVQREIEELQQGGGSASAYKDVTTAYEQGGGTMSARAYVETLADGMYCIKTLSENYYYHKTTVNGQVYLRQTVYYDDDSGVEEEIYCNGVKMDMLPAGGTDVQLNGTSIVQDGVANIALSGSLEYADGYLRVRHTAVENITQRVSTRALTLDKLDSAVKAALCDGSGPAWTAEEQAAARARLGILTTEEVTF